MVKDGMGFTPGATLCSGIQVFVQDLKGIDIDLASEKHELSVFLNDFSNTNLTNNSWSVF